MARNPSHPPKIKDYQLWYFSLPIISQCCQIGYNSFKMWYKVLIFITASRGTTVNMMSRSLSVCLCCHLSLTLTLIGQKGNIRYQYAVTLRAPMRRCSHQGRHPCGFFDCLNKYLSRSKTWFKTCLHPYWRHTYTMFKHMFSQYVWIYIMFKDRLTSYSKPYLQGPAQS